MRDSSVHPVSDASTPGSESPQLATNDQPVAHTRATRVRAEKAWMPDAAAHPVFDASTLRSESPQLAAPRPTSCPHARSTRESQGVGVRGAESVRCAALCSGVAERSKCVHALLFKLAPRPGSPVIAAIASAAVPAIHFEWTAVTGCLRLLPRQPAKRHHTEGKSAPWEMPGPIPKSGRKKHRNDIGQATPAPYFRMARWDWSRPPPPRRPILGAAIQ